MNSNEPFRRTINDFISEKRAIGYEYDKNEQILMRVANLHEKMGYTESVLPKELVVKWTEKTPYETEVNRLHRISTLRGLAEYMQRIGLPAYSIPRKSIPYREGTYVPYIYTDDELARIFTAADSIIPTAEIPFRQIQFSLLVRMLYGTGARISELLNLEKQDFNLQQGTILIRHAKLDKERIIPISESLRVRTVSYMKEMTQYGVWNNTCYLIPNSVGNCYSPNSIYHYFRRILWDAGISHGGRGKGPRVHDFRHTYAVHCLRNWTREDKDLTVALPYLSAYMGHAGARSTQYYLRLTAELYPDIISRLDDAYGWMIPEVPYERNLYLSAYLPGQRNVSTNTVKSYRDTFRLMLIYFRDEENIPPERIQMKSITRNLICKFLDWLEKERNCSITTRNQRLACIHAFIRYIQSETPENLLEYQRILGIPSKKGIHKSLDYLSAEAVSAILKQPEQTCKRGRRDLVLLTLLYDSGARVQELIDLTVIDLRLEAPATVTLHGKGRKMRCIPLMSPTVQLLKNYLSENELYEHPEKSCHPLFFNSRKQKLTRAGISYIINKYLSTARMHTEMILPNKISPHVFRHSKAMHMLQAGVNLIYIRDFLGHVNVTTTEIYAKADADVKRRALEQAYINVSNLSQDDWNEDKSLMEWLSALCK